MPFAFKLLIITARVSLAGVWIQLELEVDRNSHANS